MDRQKYIMIIRLKKEILRWCRKAYWAFNFSKSDFSIPSEGNYPRQIFFDYVEKSLGEVIDCHTPPTAVLEVGCGDGVSIARLAEKFPSLNFYGIDLQSGAIRAARARYGHVQNLSFLSTDLTSAPKVVGSANTLVLSCATLIYLSPSALAAFLGWSGLTRLMICEIASKGSKLVKENIFIHPYQSVFATVGANRVVAVQWFDYPPWSPRGRANHAVESDEYSGAIFDVKFER